jgi:ElaA protein
VSDESTQVRSAALADLDAATLYALLRLRVDVFVVEQECAYAELDGRDAEAATTHLWLADGAGPTAYLRVLRDASGECRIGRVCTRGDARGRGLAAALMAEALALTAAAPVVLDAQSHLQDWYARFGFEVDGPGFVEDGIPHVPMRRTAPTVVP